MESFIKIVAKKPENKKLQSMFSSGFNTPDVPFSMATNMEETKGKIITIKNFIEVCFNSYHSFLRIEDISKKTPLFNTFTSLLHV